MTETAFIDLFPELLAMAGAHKDTSPHKIARQFVIEEGVARGGVEVIVAIDRLGKFIGAGTQNLPAAVAFPPAITNQLSDPKAGLTIHHNHPPADEPYFSDKDMHGLADNCGIDWLLMHTEKNYSAIRAADRMFQIDKTSMAPAAGLPTAYKTALRIAQFTIFRQNLSVNPDSLESTAPELGLQALQQVGAISHFSSLNTGLGQNHEQNIVERILFEIAADLEKSGGAAIWGTESRSLHATPGGNPGTNRQTSLPNPSTLQIEFDQFVDTISRQDAASSYPRQAGRPKSAKLSETGGSGSGLASGGPARKSILESRRRSAQSPIN